MILVACTVCPFWLHSEAVAAKSAAADHELKSGHVVIRNPPAQTTV